MKTLRTSAPARQLSNISADLPSRVDAALHGSGPPVALTGMTVTSHAFRPGSMRTVEVHPAPGPLAFLAMVAAPLLLAGALALLLVYGWSTP